jgi:hypothetical protein
MADTAYKVLQDTSLPRPIRTSTTTDGVEVEEVTGQAYAAGDYVYASELSAEGRQRIEDGELDDFLEKSPRGGRDGAPPSRPVCSSRSTRSSGTRCSTQGHRVIEKDQVLDLRAAGADAAREFLEASKEGPNDANPGITEQPSFVEVSSISEDEPVLPVEGRARGLGVRRRPLPRLRTRASRCPRASRSVPRWPRPRVRIPRRWTGRREVEPSAPPSAASRALRPTSSKDSQ